jgi:type VI secretion system protein ImpC
MFGRTGGPGPIDRRAADGLIAEVDRYLSAQLDRVMRHPEFGRIEAAWRGLKFLIDRVDFREPIRLEIIPAGREKLAQVIETLVEEPAPDAPVAAVVTDFEFGASGPEMELLRGAAEAAAQLQAPLLASVGPSFFGKASAGEVARISNLRAHLEAPEYVKWRGLAEAEASRWVGLAFNRFLLRSGSDESGARGEGLWGNPAWAVGALLARSFAATGWAGHITGVRGGGAIEDLPLAEHLLPSGDTTQIPLETIFLKDRQYDFFEAGFMVLQCGENQDAAILLQSPTAHRPEKYSDARETEISRWRATLTYQMVASRFVQHLAPLLSSLVTSGSPSEIQAWIERGLRRLANLDALEVRIQESKERPGFWDLHLRIRPGPAIWTLPVDIELELPIRRQ